MLRVLVFTHHYPSPQYPTRASYSTSTYGALARHCELRIVAPIAWWFRVRRPIELVRAPTDSSTGIAATFPTWWSVPRLVRLHERGLWLSLRRYVRRVHDEFPFDVLLSAWAYPDAAAASRFAAELGVPHVTTVLGSDVNEIPRLPGLAEPVRRGLCRADRVVAVSGALGERLVELGVSRDRIVVQHNGVDGRRFAIRDRLAERAALGLPGDRRIVLYVGNLQRAKGGDILLDAQARLVSEPPPGGPPLVCIVGGGELAEPLREQVDRLRIGRHVRLLGPKLHADIHPWMSASDLLCLPSRREGCPNVVLEALASGRPVVAARVGGVPELITEENGVLVAPEDPAALAAGLREALGRTYDPEALRATVPALSWDVVGDRYHDLLLEVLAERGRRATEG